jgi:rRNA processing protein Krr1/Pno1
MESVFVVQHMHVLPSGEDDVKLVGVYQSLEAARSAVERLRTQPGFRDHPRIVDPEQDTDEQGSTLERIRSTRIIGRRAMSLCDAKD